MMRTPWTKIAVALAFAAAMYAITERCEAGVGSSFTSDDAATPATLADLDDAEHKVLETWARVPFTTRNAMFVVRPAELFGGYAKRSASTFAPGEKLLSYVEPVGYAYKAAEPDSYTFGITIDFEVLTPEGKVLAGQKAFQSTDLTSHTHNREFFLNITMSLDGITPGDYVLAYTLHDKVGGKITRVEQPFTIKVGA